VDSLTISLSPNLAEKAMLLSERDASAARGQGQGEKTTFDRILHAVSNDLVSAGLLTPGQTAELLRHAAGFPVLPAHRVFLEYRLGSNLTLEGYGHGFDTRTLHSLLRSAVDFAAAEPLAAALALDPFAEDRARYLDLEADTDPNWIEYDHADEAFSDDPGVFFSFPARFRVGSSGAWVQDLEAKLDPLLLRPEGDGSSFWDLLDTIVRSAPEGRPIGLYRLGLCTGRKPDWVRVVLNDVSRHTFDALGSCRALPIDQDPVGWIVDELVGLGDADPQLAASVTMANGAVEAIDIEAPYFHRIADDRERRTRTTAFCRLLAERDLVSAASADILARSAVVHLHAPDRGVHGALLLNHLKFGVAGSTHGRIKAYFELLLRTDN